MNLAICMTKTINKAFNKVCKKLNDSCKVYTYVDANNLLNAMQNQKIQFDRILFKPDFFLVDPENDLQDVYNYLVNNSPDTDCIMIYAKNQINSQLSNIIDLYTTIMHSPNYCVAEFETNKMSQEDLKGLVVNGIEMYSTSSQDDYYNYNYDEDDQFSQEPVNIVTEDDYNYDEDQSYDNNYSGYDDNEDYIDNTYDSYDNADNYEYNDGYSEEPDYQDDYGTQEDNYYQENTGGDDIDFSPFTYPSNKKYVVMIGTPSIPTHLIATDMATELINSGNRVAVVDLDEQFNMLTKCFDLHDVYKMCGNHSITCKTSYHDSMGVDLITNGIGVPIKKNDVADLVQSGMLNGFDTVIFSCPLSCLHTLPTRLLLQADIRVMMLGSFDDMLTAYGAVTNRKNVSGSDEDILYENSTLFIWVEKSGNLLVTRDGFERDLATLEEEVIWTRNLWTQPYNPAVVI